jgi:hypothetical protein
VRIREVDIRCLRELELLLEDTQEALRGDLRRILQRDFVSIQHLMRVRKTYLLVSMVHEVAGDQQRQSPATRHSVWTSCCSRLTLISYMHTERPQRSYCL